MVAMWVGSFSRCGGRSMKIQLRSLQRFVATPIALVVLLAAATKSFGAEPIVLEGAIVTLIEHAEVPARALGPIEQLSVSEGDVVKVGDLLAKIDDGEAALDADRAAIELAVARRDAANELPVLAATKAEEAAKAELKRATDSVAKYEKSISQSELDRLKLAADEAGLRRRQAIHERETAELTARVKDNELQTIRRRLQLHQIVAPISGVVVEVKRRRGEWVEPGVPVVRLLLMERLRVEAFYDAAKLPTDLVGKPVMLRIAPLEGEAVDYPGRITFVHPEVNPINGQVRIWAEVENREGRLRSGMQGTLRITSAETATAPRVGAKP